MLDKFIFDKLPTRNGIGCNKSCVRAAIRSSSVCLKGHTVINSRLTIKIGKPNMSKCIVAIEVRMLHT